MKKISGKLSIKIGAMALILVTGLTLILSSGMLIFQAMVTGSSTSGNEGDYLQNKLLRQYGYALLSQKISGEASDWTGLEDGPIDYSVYDATTKKWVYGQETNRDKSDTVVTATENGHIIYYLDNLQSALWHTATCYEDGTEENSYGYLEIVYNLKDGLFYAEFEIGYYPLESFELTTEDNEKLTFTADITEEGETAYGYTAIENGEKFEDSYIDAKGYPVFQNDGHEEFYFKGLEVYEYIDSLNEDFYKVTKEIAQSNLVEENYQVNYLTTSSISVKNPDLVEVETEEYWVYLSYNDNNTDADLKAQNVNYFKSGMRNYFPQEQKLESCYDILDRLSVPLLIVSILGLICGIAILSCQAGHRPGSDEIVLRLMDKCPYFLYLCLAITAISLGAAGNVGLGAILIGGGLDIPEFIGLSIFLYVAWGLVAIALLMSTVVRIKKKVFKKYSLCGYIAEGFRSYSHKAVEKTDLSAKVYLIFGAISLSELVTLLIAQTEIDTGVFIFLLIKIAEAAIVFRFLKEMKLLEEGGERIAQGDYSKPISTEKMLWHLKKHGENLNHVSDGISKAVEEQMKSERFQTELITNVSHDIKTPLTSIINYVDLMKKEEITDKTMLEYMDVLDRQSNRLKKLIEDLIEASKASSGSIKVNMEEIDAVVMLDQVTGEFKEKLNAQGLEVVVTKPEPPVVIMADGRHFWRVLDNLMGNIVKYAQSGTRVYVDMTRGQGMVKLTFRNTSREMLNISAEELMERFVRGDSSRNSDGHGLGLNIAQSLTKLMGGNLHIEIDGDLFKVTLTFPEAGPKTNCL